MGVEKECNYTHFEQRDAIVEDSSHWITENLTLSNVRFNDTVRGVYPLTAKVLRLRHDDYVPYGWKDVGHVMMSVNEYGKGRSVYVSGMENTNEAYRLFYKSVLWACKKERSLHTCYCENPNVDVYYYPNLNRYALINLSNEDAEETYYDVNGNSRKVTIEANAIKWIDG